MALPNSQLVMTEGTGKPVATQLIGSKDFQASIPVDYEGHLAGSLPGYLLYQHPRVLTAAATDLFDLFNASGSGKKIRLRGIYAQIQHSAASAFVASFQFAVHRTSAVGTTGTAHTFESTSSTPAAGAVNISRVASAGATLPAQITARSLPGGGATAGPFLFMISLIPEESQPSTALIQGVNWIPEFPMDNPYELAAGEGLKIRQITAVASTGVAFGWTVSFVVV